MPAFSHPALRVTITRAWINWNSLAALTATFSADRFYTPAHPGIILADHQRDVLGHFIGISTRAPGGAVPLQHFNFLSIKHNLQLTYTGFSLSGSLSGFALCCWFSHQYLPLSRTPLPVYLLCMARNFFRWFSCSVSARIWWYSLWSMCSNKLLNFLMHTLPG